MRRVIFGSPALKMIMKIIMNVNGLQKVKVLHIYLFAYP